MRRGARKAALFAARLLFPHAGLDKIPALLSDHLLVDRLLQAIDTGLRHAELHLVLPVLPLLALNLRQAAGALAACGAG